MNSSNTAPTPSRCIRVRLDADLHRELCHAAIDRQTSVADLVREAARLLLDQGVIVVRSTSTDGP